MCGLCGLIGEEGHWSDPLMATLPRRRERLRRIQAINRILKPFRLTVSDVQGASYLLQGATGRQALANGLEELWQQAELLIGRPLDPFAETILTALERPA